jgi:hypothetical protein
MAITGFQATVLRLLAQHRVQRGDRYVAGGGALNELLRAPRRSRDIDLFHDTDEALSETWKADRKLLEAGGYAVAVLREAPSFVEALISRSGDRTAMQWARDSAFRFFPLIESELMGLALHPFDLATNKVLAMAGRLEVRDWVDVLHCDRNLQPLGYLVWAACGKDPGYNPRSLLAAAGRQHYSQAEVDALDFEGGPPDAGTLGAQWHRALREAAGVIDTLPARHVGTCVAGGDGALYRGDVASLIRSIGQEELRFHAGSIGGSWPKVV